jgi:hemoglobin/transferrin/lactoferrin receptor protein
MRSKFLHGTTVLVAIAIGLIGNPRALGQAVDLSTVSPLILFNIKAQTLAAALDAFALQTHQQILFPPELVRGKMTRGVKGTLSSDAALSEILSGTGLAFSRSAGGFILVSHADSRRGPASRLPITPHALETGQQD